MRPCVVNSAETPISHPQPPIPNPFQNLKIESEAFRREREGGMPLCSAGVGFGSRRGRRHLVCWGLERCWSTCHRLPADTNVPSSWWISLYHHCLGYHCVKIFWKEHQPTGSGRHCESLRYSECAAAAGDQSALYHRLHLQRLLSTPPALLLGTSIETLLLGFLFAGLQKKPTERKRSYVTKRIIHILGYIW
jgi:hypothetical protein